MGTPQNTFTTTTRNASGRTRVRKVFPILYSFSMRRYAGDYVNISQPAINYSYTLGTSASNFALTEGYPVVLEFFSDLFKYYYGFSASLICIPQRCSNAGPYDLNVSGTVITDKDGASTRYYYTTWENCKWTVHCGAIYITQVNGYAYTGDYMRFINSSGAIVAQHTGKTTVNGAQAYGFIAGPNPLINFVTNGVSNYYGLTVTYKCYVSACSTNSSNVNRTTFPGVISSDTDGNGTATYLNREACAWTVKCPPNWFVVLKNVSGKTLPGDVLRLTNSTGSLLFPPFQGVNTTLQTISLPAGNYFMPTNIMNVNFDTNSANVSNGFSLEYTCAVSQCNANTTARVFSTDGTIMTDADGSGSAYKYGNNEDCLWTISCASKQLRVNRLVGNSADADDILSFYDANGTIVGTYARGTFDARDVFFEGDTFVRLQTGRTGAGNGFTIEFTCIVPKCTTPGWFNEFTAPVGTITSDTDGSGPVNYGNDEACPFTINCPNQGSSKITSVAGVTASAEDYVVLIDSLGQERAVYSGAITYTPLKIFPRGPTRVRFFTDHQDTAQGFTLSYKCYPQQCSDGGAVVRSALNGTLISDEDGAGSAPYDNEEDCHWKIQCPAGMGAAITSLVGSTYDSNDIVSLVEPATDEVLEPRTIMSFSGAHFAVTEPVLTRPGALEVSFVTDTANVGAGFSLAYTCIKGQCSSNLDSYVMTALEGTVRSDSDGVGSAPYFNNERCEYRIRCPSDRAVYLRQVIGNLSGADDLLVITHSDGSDEVLVSSGVFSASFTLPAFAGDVVITFTSGLSGTGRGFTIEYRCVLQQCSSNTSDTLLDSGAIISDSDGAKSFNYANREDCEWGIDCKDAKSVDRIEWPEGDAGDENAVVEDDIATVRVDTVTGTTAEVEDVLTLVDEDGNVVRSFNGSIADTTVGMLPAGPVAVQFTTNNAITQAGFTLNYTCLGHRCSTTSPRQLLQYSGILKSDRDGAASYQYQNNETCRWEIRCADGMVVAISSILGTVSSPDNLTLVDSNDATLWYTGNINTAPGFFPDGSVFIGFTSDGSTTGNGFTINYQCYLSQCSANTTNFVREDGYGIIMSDKDGAGDSEYQNNEDCMWTISCGDGESTAVSLVGTLAAGDVLQIINTDLGTIVSNLTGILNDDSTTYAFPLGVRFVTNSKNTSKGFNLTYMCFSEKCVSPTESLLTTYPNQILTDTDGQDGTVKYRDNQACSWTVGCPVGMFVAFSSIAGQSADKADILNITDSATGKLISEYKNGIFDTSLMTLFSSVTVGFVTNGSVRGAGFTLSFTCLPSSCSNTEKMARETSTGIIKTDSDGSGVTKYLNSERCAWTIDCPNDGSVYIISVAGKSYGAGDYLAITDANAVVRANYSGNATFSDLGMLPVGVMSVSFTSDASGTLNGYTLQYMCYEQQCSANETDYSRVGSGIISSDIDGVGASTYRNNEACEWSVSCPNGFFAITSLATNIASTDSLKVLDVLGTTTIATYTGTLNYNQSTAYGFYTAGDVIIRFASDATGVAPGFALTYQCFDDKCSSTTLDSANGKSGTFGSDTDGNGPQVYLNNENCVWTVQCASGEYAAFDMSGSLGTGDKLLITSLLAVQVKLYTAVPFNDKTLLVADGAIFTFTSDASITGAGFTVSYTCFPSQCSSPNFDTSLSDYPGVILTDNDGAGSATQYRASEACSWLIQCPDDYGVLFSNIDGNSVDATDILLAKDGASATVFSLSNGNASALNYYTAQSSVTLTWTTSATGFGNGYTIAYTCVQSQCSSVNDTEDISDSWGGTIVSDSDGAGSLSKYMNAESCNWNIECPNGGSFYVTSLTGTTAGSGDYVKIIDADDNALGTYYTNIAFTDLGMLAPGPISIQFISDTSATSNGFTLKYLCFNQQCSNNHSATLTTSGVIMSDTDGSGTAQYKANEDCSWNVDCGTGHSVAIKSIAGSTQSGVDVLTLTIGEDSMTYSGVFSVSADAAPGIMSSSTLQATFTSDATSHGNGFSVDYACLSSQCLAPSSGSTLTQYTGEILSDTDGSGPTKYMNNEACAWTIRCPVGWSTFVNVAGTTVSGDVVQIKSLDGTLLASYSGTFQDRSRIYSGDLSVFFTSDSANVAQGFSLQYECHVTKCSTNISQAVLTTAGTITTDADGAGSAYVARLNELCSWTIQCPANTFVVLSLISGTSSSVSDVLTVKDSSMVTIASYSNGAFNENMLLATNVAYLTFTSGSSVANTPGFAVSYGCAAQQCSSQVTSPVVTETSSRIFSDNDGSGSSPQYMNNEDCSWTISCFGGTGSVRITSMAGTTYNANDYLNITDAAKVSRVLSGTQFSAFSDFGIMPAGPVTVRFKTDATGRGAGFDFNYLCYRAQCSSNESTYVRTTAGTISSDKDGPGATPYESNEKCAWKIQCPNDGSALITSATGTTASSSDKVSLYDNSNGLLVSYSGAISSTGVNAYGLAPAGVTTVYFDTDASGTSAGFSLTYECRPLQCTAPTAGSNFKSVSGSFASSASPYFNHENCQWTITCPFSGFVALDVAGTVANSADSLVLREGGGVGTVLQTINTPGVAISDETIFWPSPLSLAFKSDGSQIAQGLNIEYRCYVGQCSNNLTTQTFTAYPRIFMTDMDGSDPVPYRANERCQWTLTCPVDFIVLMTVSGSSAAGDQLMAFNPAVPNTPLQNFTGADLDSVALTARLRSIIVRFESNTDSAVDAGFTFTFDCLDISTPAPTPSPTPEPIPCEFANCSNHALDVDGTSATGCICSCETGYAQPVCGACDTYYSGYPTCTPTVCTSNADCNGHATAVDGF